MIEFKYNTPEAEQAYNEIARCHAIARRFLVIKEKGKGKQNFILLTGEEVNTFETDKNKHIFVAHG